MPKKGQPKNKGVFNRPCYNCGDKNVYHSSWNKELGCCDVCATKMYERSLEKYGYDEYFVVDKVLTYLTEEEREQERKKNWCRVWFENNKGMKSSGETFVELIDRYNKSFKNMIKKESKCLS